MALECDPPHLGDIGDQEKDHEPNSDRMYEAEIERRMERVIELKMSVPIPSGLRTNGIGVRDFYGG